MTTKKEPVVIHDADRLLLAREMKQSVVVRLGGVFQKVLPAAFVCNMNWGVVTGMLKAGIEIYEKPPRVRAKFPRMGKQAAEKPPSNKEIAG